MKYIVSNPLTYIVKTVLLLTITLPLQALFFHTAAAESQITPTQKSATVEKSATAEKNTTANKSAKTDKITTANQAPLVIKSQVKGSQEQPNVIYITPWQGIDNPISIDGDTQKIVLPHFKPINPKSFKQQARLFHKESSIQSEKQKEAAVSASQQKQN